MNIEDDVRAAIIGELQRQAEAEGPLKVSKEPDGYLRIEGRVDLDELAMAVVGSIAGGP